MLPLLDSQYIALILHVLLLLLAGFVVLMWQSGDGDVVKGKDDGRITVVAPDATEMPVATLLRLPLPPDSDYDSPSPRAPESPSSSSCSSWEMDSPGGRHNRRVKLRRPRRAFI